LKTKQSNKKEGILLNTEWHRKIVPLSKITSRKDNSQVNEETTALTKSVTRTRVSSSGIRENLNEA
jgi:hypothetical protein